MIARFDNSPLLLGLIVGLVFGAANMIHTWLFPLADDTIGAVLAFYGPMFFVWAFASFRAARRTGRVWSGVTSGAAVAFGTFCVFTLLVLIRVNLFLDELTGRADWQNMMLRFRASGYDSLRLFINVDYVTGAPLKLGVSAAIGAVMGLIGGCLGGLRHRRMVTTAMFVLAATLTVQAQPQPPLPIKDGQVIPLWNGAAPDARGTDESDIPALTVYLPRTMRPSTPAIIVCPGGSYVALASNHEGRQVASFLNSLGIAAFVLRYRLGPRYHHPTELGDAQRAIRTLRSHAADWRLDPARIGLMGFSAGGHLAMSASTWFDAGNPSADDTVDRMGSRPDIVVLGYPVISMTASWTHRGSKRNLLGDDPDPDLARRLSGELAVTKETPPTFIFQTNEDTVVPAENSVQYFLALRQAGVPVEMHVFEPGVHGVGLANDNVALAPWSTLLANWLRGRGFIK